MLPNRSGLRALLLLTTSTLAACAGGPDPDTAAPSHMFAHFMQVGVIQSALVSGDVDATRSPARWLANHEEKQPFPPAGLTALERMRSEARSILAQRDLAEVASSLARMGTACGSCHRALGGGPTIRVGEAPPLSSALAEHMARHAWAIDRMWEGIVAPSDAAWRAGASALAGQPLDFGDPSSRSGPGAELAQKVHELGHSAREAQDPEARAEVYGRLLRTCGGCHGELGTRGR